ncbi:hypothetical protein [Eel River basin pequenovirus]|nr:hypothetical protein [Eel River basin pequenovirus]
MPRYYRDKIGKPKFGASVVTARRFAEYEEKRKAEMERLSKLGHKEPALYEDEKKYSELKPYFKNVERQRKTLIKTKNQNVSEH